MPRSTTFREADRKIPCGISLPRSMVKEIDEKRGRMPRSAYVLLLLEKGVKKGPRLVEVPAE